MGASLQCCGKSGDRGPSDHLIGKLGCAWDGESRHVVVVKGSLCDDISCKGLGFLIEVADEGWPMECHPTRAIQVLLIGLEMNGNVLAELTNGRVA